MLEAMRYILVDMFSSARTMLQSISFGDFNFYSFLLSCLFIFFIFKFSVLILRR